MTDIEEAGLTQQNDECDAAADGDNGQKIADMEGSALEKITGFKAFSFEELQRATNNFSPANMLGEGANGQVFHGLLGEKHIAVKRLHEGVEEAQKEEFIREIRHLGAVNHQNILSLMGFCLHAPTPLLVTEKLYSLHNALYQDTNHLNWTTRFQIALGVAKGLAYMHTGARSPMLHCDIKPGNILLHPENLTRAYIADFGVVHLLAHLQPAESGREIEASWYYGTAGYMAPEVKPGKRLSTKSDVYSFGKLLYVLVTGNENVHHMPASLIRKSEPPPPRRQRTLAEVETLLHILFSTVDCSEEEKHDPSDRRPRCGGRSLGICEGFDRGIYGDSAHCVMHTTSRRQEANHGKSVAGVGERNFMPNSTRSEDCGQSANSNIVVVFVVHDTYSGCLLPDIPVLCIL